jgi:membrane protease YdiL (CAAX protease family)
MAEGRDSSSGGKNSIAGRSKRRDFLELGVTYGLILAVVWTPRPWQKVLWWVAAAAIVTFTCISFDGLKAMGLRRENFFRSLWVVGLALLVTAGSVTLAARLHTLHLPPGGPVSFFANYCGYALWAFGQQFLLQCFFLSRLLRVLPNRWSAVILATLIFSAAHLPSPILAPATLIWGLVSCLVFLRYRNLYSLALAHAILGITLAISIPGPVDHNMRVGLGYLTYGHTHKPLASGPVRTTRPVPW